MQGRFERPFFIAIFGSEDDTLRTQRLYAALLLLVLLAAYAGQKVHIYNEDHAHFSAHCGDLVPDNGAHTIIVDRCIIDDFYFFPYLDIAPTVHSFYAEMLAVLLPEATRCKLYEQASGISLRAPPVSVTSAIPSIFLIRLPGAFARPILFII